MDYKSIMTFISKEKDNKKYYEEFMYIASSYYIFKKRPKTKVRSLINIYRFYIIIFFILSIVFIFIPRLDYLSPIFFTLFCFGIYLFVESKYRLREYLKGEDSLIQIDEAGIANICADKMTVKLPWKSIEYIIINKYSICVLPKNFSAILIGIEIGSKDDVYQALKKYKKLNLLVDNSSRYY